MLLNAATMSIGVYVLALHYLLAQAVATGFVLVWTYGANRYWTFR
jgi:putative flippase GtrA